jgi:3-mercaptopyruvate sulfurtransferase SseA
MTKGKWFGLLVLLALTTSACSTPTQLVPTASVEPTSQPVPTVIVEPTSQPASGLPQTEADVPRVTVQEAKAAFESGEAVIVDVRSAEAFAAQHIQGALSIPLTGIEADPASVTLEKDQWIITYCT